jgi:hypothetical protein
MCSFKYQRDWKETEITVFKLFKINPKISGTFEINDKISQKLKYSLTSFRCNI